MSTDATDGAPEKQPAEMGEQTPQRPPEAIPKVPPVKMPQAVSKGTPILRAVLLVVGGFLLLIFLAGFLLPALAKAQEAAHRGACMCNVMQIGLSMKMYAQDHNGLFMDLVGDDGHTEPGVGEDGTVSSLPSRSGFAILMNQAYLTTAKVFVCPSSDDRVVDETFPSDFKNADLEELVLGENKCSYGWDPTKKNSAHATCAILADKPPASGATRANEGTAKNNSDNHDGEGQNVFYNDGHVKWRTLPIPDSYDADDPDIYLGDTGYETSNTDAKIIR